MIRAAVLLLMPVALAQTVPMDVRLGAQAGTVQFSIPGASVPLVAEGAEWVCTLEIVYRVVDREGKALDQATETIPVRLNAAQKAAAVAQPLALTRPLPKVAQPAELRVEITARPAGMVFAGALALEPGSTAANLALVPFQVEGPGGKFVTSLTAADIRVTEDGVEVPAQLHPVGGQARETVPVEVILLYDRGRNVTTIGGTAPGEFRKALLEEFPNLRVAIYGVGGRLVRLAGLTRDAEALANASSAIAAIPGGEMPLFSSIEAAMQRFEEGRAAVRILVVFAEGGRQNTAGATPASVLDAAGRAGVTIYPVSVAAQLAPTASRANNNTRGQLSRPSSTGFSVGTTGEFRALAESGGKVLSVLPSGNVLPSVLGEVAKRLRDSYVASYRPSVSDKERRRKVKVTLAEKGTGKLVGGERTVVR